MEDKNFRKDTRETDKTHNKSCNVSLDFPNDLCFIYTDFNKTGWQHRFGFFIDLM